MRTQELMSRDVRTCSPTDSLEQAARAMWEQDVGCLVVVDSERKPVGMVTDRDLLMAAYTKGAQLRALSVNGAMAAEVITCRVDTPLSQLEDMMRSAQIRRVPVVHADGRLAGIVALGDIAASASAGAMHAPELPGLARTLTAITSPRTNQRTEAAQ